MAKCDIVKLLSRAVLFRVFNARYTTRAHTLVVSNVRPDDIPEPRLRSRFLDGSLCQVVPNGAGDYRQRKSRSKVAQLRSGPNVSPNYETLPVSETWAVGSTSPGQSQS